MSESTIKSLENALESNIRLQREIARRVQAIAEKKASNRRLSSRITAQIVSTWDEIDSIRTPSIPIVPKTKKKRKREAVEDDAKYSSKWNYDPYRKWTRRFFVDPDGSIPEPNEDTIKRRKLEEGKFFHHTSPPWSKKEEKTLLAIVESQMKASKQGLDSLDFEEVASALEERMKTDKNRPHSFMPRSAMDCRLKYIDTKKQPPFTKEESLKLLEEVHLHDGSPSWPDVAASVNRSTWQCLTSYKTKLNSSRPLPFTPPEDELLLKIAAAAGPQYVLNINVAADLAARFFPNRSPKQVLARLNGSLVNPNNARDLWSADEERRLVLCMKVYRDTPAPITRASAHFPDRASKPISEKWDRSLNPEYNSKPFTALEDKTLLEAIRQSPDIGWTELSKRFSLRHPRSLQQRWSEIASEDDLLLKYGTMMKQEGARRGTIKSDGLLSSNDFVVRTKKDPPQGK